MTPDTTCSTCGHTFVAEAEGGEICVACAFELALDGVIENVADNPALEKLSARARENSKK